MQVAGKDEINGLAGQRCVRGGRLPFFFLGQVLVLRTVGNQTRQVCVISAPGLFCYRFLSPDASSARCSPSEQLFAACWKKQCTLVGARMSRRIA